MVVLDLEKLSDALTFRLIGLATSDDLAFLFFSLFPRLSPLLSPAGNSHSRPRSSASCFSSARGLTSST
jgi:hypothetical protein